MTTNIHKSLPSGLFKKTTRISILAASLLLSACNDSDNNSLNDAGRDGQVSPDYSRLSVDVSAFLLEDNLKYDIQTNPSGLFISNDDDTSSFSDAQARLQLVAAGLNDNASNMSYLEAGNTSGDPIILVHGQPTQAYLWRNVIPNLPQDAHILAPDLMGYGQSSKPDIDYTFKQHSAYLRAFIESLNLDQKSITLVVHDVGSVPALAYAARFPDNIKGIAFFESLLGPVPSFDMMPAQAQMFRTPQGNASIISENTFIEGMLVSEEMSSHTFSEEELLVYRQPFLLEEDRDVLAIVPREVPVAGGSDDSLGDTNIALLSMNAMYLMNNPVPRLFMYSNQGVLIPKAVAPQIIAGFNPAGAMTAVDMGDARHFWQEEIPEQLGQQISLWYNDL